MPRLPFGGQAGAGSAPPTIPPNWELIETIVSAASQDTVIFTPASALTSANFSCVMMNGYLRKQLAGQLLGIVNSDEASTPYSVGGSEIIGGVETIVARVGTAQAVLGSTNMVNSNAFVAFAWYNYLDSVADLRGQSQWIMNGSAGRSAILGCEYDSDTTTGDEITEIELRCDAGNYWDDSIFNVYALRRVA